MEDSDERYISRGSSNIACRTVENNAHAGITESEAESDVFVKQDATIFIGVVILDETRQTLSTEVDCGSQYESTTVRSKCGKTVIRNATEPYREPVHLQLFAHR
jgi:hypothetical protein